MLKRVSIQNFKSLKDVTLDLQKVNLLIGPNNSGKTNFLKAFKFCYDSINEGEEFTYSTNLKYLQMADNLVNIHLALDNTEPFNTEKFDHIIIEENNDEGLLFENEFYSKLNNSLDVSDQDVIYEFSRDDLVGYLGKLEIHRPDPNKIITPAAFSADEVELKGDSSNLISFLFYLNTNYKRAYQQIENDLSNCTQDITSLSTPPVKVGKESKIGLKFFGKNDESYWAEDVSEGVLYFLALITIVNQPDPPKLLLLEEPEKGIHPRRIREVMDFIFRLAEEKDVQIILTSHNEHVLDEFATRPESVFVFDKDDEGATYVRNLQREIIEPTNERNRELDLDPVDLTSNLSENWLYGLLGGVPAIP